MTKEELEKEATEWVLKNSGYSKNEFHGRKAIKTYLAGAEPREKRIDCLTLACENYREEMEKNLADAVKLEKENAELKSELTKKADTNHSLVEQMADLESENADLQDKLNNLSSVAEVRLANWQRYEKENAELKKACDETQELLDKQIEATYKLDKENTKLRDNYEQYKAVAEPEIKSLKEENAELKERNRDLLESCEGATMMYKDLCKAKEIIKKLRGLYFSPVVTKDDVKRQDEILAEAEQFISEVEK